MAQEGVGVAVISGRGRKILKEGAEKCTEK